MNRSSATYTVWAMGAWSVEPFGNDVAADWAWELEDESDWGVVDDALADALEKSLIKRGDRILLLSTGAGLTIGGAVLRW